MDRGILHARLSLVGDIGMMINDVVEIMQTKIFTRDFCNSIPKFICSDASSTSVLLLDIWVRFESARRRFLYHDIETVPQVAPSPSDVTQGRRRRCQHRSECLVEAVLVARLLQISQSILYQPATGQTLPTRLTCVEPWP